MIITLYDTGLRLNELLNLKPEDIIPGRDILHVHAGKGKKDRIVPLGSYLKKRLDLYRHLYQPADYLFEGRNGGKFLPGITIDDEQVAGEIGNQEAGDDSYTPALLRHIYAGIGRGSGNIKNSNGA